MKSPLYQTLAQRTRKALNQGRLDEAQTLVHKLKEQEPVTLETRGLELELALKRENLRDAGILATQLVQLFPSSSRIQFLTGQLEFQRQRYGKAERHFRQSHHIHPSPRTLLWLGKCLALAGKSAEALAILEPLYREAGRGGLELAWVYENLGRYHEARICYERLLAQNPDHEAAQQRLAHLIQEHRSATTTGPNDTENPAESN